MGLNDTDARRDGPGGTPLCEMHTQFTLPVAAMVLITVLNDVSLIFSSAIEVVCCAKDDVITGHPHLHGLRLRDPRHGALQVEAR